MNIVKAKKIKESIKPVEMLVASKYFNTDEIRELYKSGITIFGENRVDSLVDKYESLKDLNIKWHFIGHLQRNKAKEIINKIECLHSLDSLELATIINKERMKPLDVYIELKLVDSDTKSGLKKEDIDDFLKEIKKYNKINVLGFMVMANKDSSIEETKKVFIEANEINKKYGFKRLSMGMSSDYLTAIENGSTIVRLGHILI